MDNRPWLVFGKHGIQVVQPTIFSPDDEKAARAHFDKLSEKLGGAYDGIASVSVQKIRCDDRRKP